eukprot:1159369-Pelagomonas_calceolata.AAC.11
MRTATAIRREAQHGCPSGRQTGRHAVAKQQHLTCCARSFKSTEFSVVSFPNPAAIGEWLSAKKRRGVK